MTHCCWKQREITQHVVTYAILGQGHTFGVERDEAVAQRPFVHRLVEDDVLWEDDHGDVLKPAQPLQDLGHRLGLGLLHHAADPHQDLPLWGLDKDRHRKQLCLTDDSETTYKHFLLKMRETP